MRQFWQDTKQRPAKILLLSLFSGKFGCSFGEKNNAIKIKVSSTNLRVEDLVFDIPRST